MTIYKLYKKQEGKDAPELGWELIITGDRMLSYMKPGLEPSEVYSHYEIELVCFCEHGNLDYSFWKDCVDVECEIEDSYDLIAISENLDFLMKATYDMANGYEHTEK